MCFNKMFVNLVIAYEGTWLFLFLATVIINLGYPMHHINISAKELNLKSIF